MRKVNKKRSKNEIEKKKYGGGHEEFASSWKKNTERRQDS